MCQDHREENRELLQQYKDRCILRQRVDLSEFSREIGLSFVSIPQHPQQSVYETQSVNTSIHRVNNSSKVIEPIINDSAIFMFQSLLIDGVNYNLFYDSGCGDMICRLDAVKKLKSRASLLYGGSSTLIGVGDTKTTAHGIYQLTLPLNNKSEVCLVGSCLDKITHDFPMYPIEGRVVNDIMQACDSAGFDKSKLPKFAKVAGGSVDLMLGSKYLRYHPKEVFQLLSGLTVFRSQFVDSSGCTGVIGGPHALWSEIEKMYGFVYTPVHHSYSTFISEQLEIYNNGYQLNPDINFFKPQCHISRKIKVFEASQDAGLDTSYRCVDHRSCKKCKKGPHIQDVSFKEEAEQDLIEKSLFVDLDAKHIVAKLPFIENPLVKLAPNRDKALATYRSQIRKLEKHPDDKVAVLKSESKLQELGFVDYVKNLPYEQQEKQRSSKFHNFIPWRIMWKASSLSTPVRVVMDASQPTATGFALNDLLAKGINNMNSLLEILLRWPIQVVCFHTDVSKMYNTIRLHEDHWCFQRYLWQEGLDPSKPPEEKVIMRIMYGLTPSGNQAEHAIRLTALLSKDKYPQVCVIIHRDVYVDDCLSGANTIEEAHSLADRMTVVLSTTAFNLKGFIFSGEDPPAHLSDDGKSAVIGGHRYFPKTDEIQLNIGELNFAPKQRGRKSTKNINKVPEKLTRRHCVSRVSEVFDLPGRVTPIVARFKLDLKSIIYRRLDWDDVLPDELRSLWVTNFEMIQELRHLRFKRCVIPHDAANLQVSTIDMSDATCSIACVAIYARVLRKNGEYSCQLIFGRSKILPDGTTQPKGELVGMRLNAQSGYVIQRSFGDRFDFSVKMADSQVALFWVSNYEKPLNVGVRSQVTEIRRLSNIADWRYLPSEEMLADLGTRRNVTVAEVAPGSVWVEGHGWMKKTCDHHPVKKIEELTLNEQQLIDYRKGIPKEFWQGENH